MVIGHKRQFEYLKKVYEKGTFAHAYLFFGPEHVGKLHITREWIKLFFEPKEYETIDKIQHPDVIYLSKEKLLVSENQKEIGIDDVLELRRLASLSSSSGGHKFVIIDGADDMSEEAQNSLLKVLEEPPPKTIFILITDSLQNLFLTIVSRSVPIEFSFVADDEIARFVRDSRSGRVLVKTSGVEEEESYGLSAEVSTKAEKTPDIDPAFVCKSGIEEKILTISSGRPGIAVRALSDEDYLEKEWSAYEFFKKVFDSDTISQFLYSQKIYQEPEMVEKLIYFLLSELRKKLVSDESADQALSSLKYVFNGMDLIKRTNVNKRLLLDNLFLSLNP